jgi:hypothetical protein
MHSLAILRMDSVQCVSRYFGIGGGNMISIKNSLCQLKERHHILTESVFFIVKVIGLVFLLHLAAGGYSGNTKVTFSELTTASHHNEHTLSDKETGWSAQQKRI